MEVHVLTELTVNHLDWSSDPQNPDEGVAQSKLAIEFDWKALPQSIKQAHYILLQYYY